MSTKLKIKHCAHIELQQVVDENDGVLSIAEELINIPFKVRRVYYIYGLSHKNAQRGMHAHKELEQIIFCINGSFKLLLDDGENQQFIYLSDPNRGIYMGPKLWHKMFEFSSDCIILVFASDLYNEKDYIRNFNEFLDFIK